MFKAMAVETIKEAHCFFKREMNAVDSEGLQSRAHQREYAGHGRLRRGIPPRARW